MTPAVLFRFLPLDAPTLARDEVVMLLADALLSAAFLPAAFLPAAFLPAAFLPDWVGIERLLDRVEAREARS